MRIVVEAVACSVEDAIAAESAGANRIELCSELSVGGLSPSIGLVQAVLRNCKLPVVALLRPRSGGFNYSRHELDAMLADAVAYVEAGVSGLAFGILLSDSAIAVSACQAIIEATPGVDHVFHRAFDVIEGTDQQARILSDIGFARVLSSRTVPLNGITQVLCGGIRATNVALHLKSSLAKEIHLGPRTEVFDATGGSYGTTYPALDVAELKSVIELVRSISYPDQG